MPPGINIESLSSPSITTCPTTPIISTRSLTPCTSNTTARGSRSRKGREYERDACWGDGYLVMIEMKNQLAAWIFFKGECSPNSNEINRPSPRRLLPSEEATTSTDHHLCVDCSQVSLGFGGFGAGFGLGVRVVGLRLTDKHFPRIHVSPWLSALRVRAGMVGGTHAPKANSR